MNLELDLSIFETPLTFVSIGEAIKNSILSGKLKPGQTIPSNRELAKQLRVSRSMVMRAYQDLEGQNYITCTARFRCFVNVSITENSTPTKAQPSFQIPQKVKIDSRVAQIQENITDLAVKRGCVDNAYLPITKWQTVVDCLRRSEAFKNKRADALGSYSLRKEISTYLKRARAINCSVDNIFIFSNAALAFAILQRAVPKDIFYCNPPLSIEHDINKWNCSVERIVEETNSSGSVIWEDDSFAEYMRSPSALKCLRGVSGDSIIYQYNFDATLGSLCPLSAVIVPPEFATQLREAKELFDPNIYLAEQLALRDFLRAGLYDSAIRVQRTLLDETRASSIRFLTSFLGKSIRFLQNQNMHTLTIASREHKISEIVNAAKRANLSLAEYTHSDHYSNDEVYAQIDLRTLSADKVSSTMQRFAEEICPGKSASLAS